MTNNSYNDALQVQQYLLATGDILTSKTCEALGLSSSKCFISHLRSRINSLDSFSDFCSTGEHYFTNEEKGSSKLPLKAIIQTVLACSSIQDFTTKDISNIISVPRSSLSTTIVELVQAGRIEIIDSTVRPKRYRLIHDEEPDFLETYIQVHNLRQCKNPFSYSLLSLPILVNRSLCGMPITHDDIAEKTLAYAKKIDTSFSTSLSLAEKEHDAIERLILIVFNSGGDLRIVKRHIENELASSSRHRFVLNQLPDSLHRYEMIQLNCIPEELQSLLSTEKGIEVFYEASMQVLGADIYKAEVIQTIPSIITDIERLLSPIKYDQAQKALKSDNPIDTEKTYEALAASIRKQTAKVEIPVKRVNVQALYRNIALELKRDCSAT